MTAQTARWFVVTRAGKGAAIDVQGPMEEYAAQRQVEDLTNMCLEAGEDPKLSVYMPRSKVVQQLPRYAAHWKVVY